MKQFHTKAREHSGKLCVLPPSPGGEGRGEGERFLRSHFRSRRLKVPGTGTRDPSLRKVRASSPRLLPKAEILTAC